MAAPKKAKIEPASKDDVKEALNAVVALKEELADAKVELQTLAQSSLEAACAGLKGSIDDVSSKLCQSTEENRHAAERAQTAATELIPYLSDLKRAQASLEEGLQQSQAEARARAEQGARDLSALAAQSVKDLAEAREHARATAAETLSEAKAHAEASALAVPGSAALREQLQRGLSELELRLRRHCEGGLASLGARLDAELAAAARRHQSALESLAGALRQEASELGAAARRAAREDLARLEETQRASSAAQGARLGAVEEGAARQLEELERLEEQLGSASRETHLVRGDAEERLAAAQLENRRRLDHLGDQVRKLRELDTSGIPTRQVEWSVQSKTLQRWQETMASAAACGPEGSIFSPRFCICGCRSLRLELRLARPEELTDDQSPGNWSVYIWAPSGIELVFKVSVGSNSAVLRHSFADQEPCGAKNLFCLNEQACGEGEPLRVCFEIHEVTQERPLVGGEQPHSTGAPAVEPADSDDEAACEGSLTLQQHVNHRLLEVVRSQHQSLSQVVHRRMDVERSRAVRRVQWRLDHAAMLRQCFAEGRPICSTAFQAAGINGMQLVFYPSGCDGAKEGFCSLFVSCPAGCALRCWLWAGRLRREARPEPAEQHDLLGRVNFCRFEACIDHADESVDLVLEIEDARQPGAGAGAAGAAKAAGAPGESPCPREERASPTPGLDRTDVSALQLQSRPVSRAPERGCPEEHVRHLPPIWTSHGFRTFSDLRPREAPPGEGGRPMVRPPTSARSGSKSGALSATGDLLPMPPATPKPVPKLFSETAKVPAMPAGHRYKEYSLA